MKRFLTWIREWYITLKAFPPFSKKRRELFEVMNDRDPDNWVDAPPLVEFDPEELAQCQVDPDAWGPAGYLLPPDGEVPSRDRHARILHRTCVSCGKSKPLNEECFSRAVKNKSGFRGICRKCERHIKE